jgi:3-hydroxyisobutyrate dehydrogenase-like beta-hydroxyacid dehydrogenase
MVENLLRAGLAVVVNDLDPGVVTELVTRGARSGSLAELAGQVRIVGVCVPADPHVRAVLGGDDGLLAHLDAGSVVAIHSTVLPETVQWAAAEGSARGIRVVEAPVTGGFLAAAEGRSTFLLGGDPADVAALAPLLEACGAAQVHAGELGNASRLKLCVNLQSYATFSGVYEAAQLALRLGLPLDALKAAMRANGQLSEMVEAYLLLHEFPPETFADPGMRTQMEGYAAIIAKDLRLIEQLGADAGVPLPAARLAGELARRTYFIGAFGHDAASG